MIRHILNFTFDSKKSTDQSFYMVLKSKHLLYQLILLATQCCLLASSISLYVYNIIKFSDQYLFINLIHKNVKLHFFCLATVKKNLSY